MSFLYTTRSGEKGEKNRWGKQLLKKLPAVALRILCAWLLAPAPALFHVGFSTLSLPERVLDVNGARMK